MDHDRLIPWSEALAILHVSYRAAPARAARDEAFARLKLVHSRGPKGKAFYAARMSDVYAYIQSLSAIKVHHA